MKRLLAAVAVLVVGATSFASSGKFGLDFSWGLNVGFQNMKNVQFDYPTGVGDYPLEGKMARTDMIFPVVRVSTYDFFLLDNMLGLFASANLSFGLQFGDKVETDEVGEVKGSGLGGLSDGLMGIEFMVGPAFGIDLNENLRFQTGLGFHYLFAKSLMESVMDIASDGETPSISTHSFGIALTPQLRFSPAKKASFILGCDFIFDFGRTGDVAFSFEYENLLSGDSDTWTALIPADAMEGYFRFGFSPYIGVGINF